MAAAMTFAALELAWHAREVRVLQQQHVAAPLLRSPRARRRHRRRRPATAPRSPGRSARTAPRSAFRRPPQGASSPCPGPTKRRACRSTSAVCASDQAAVEPRVQVIVHAREQAVEVGPLAGAGTAGDYHAQAPRREMPHQRMPALGGSIACSASAAMDERSRKAVPPDRSRGPRRPRERSSPPSGAPPRGRRSMPEQVRDPLVLEHARTVIGRRSRDCPAAARFHQDLPSSRDTRPTRRRPAHQARTGTVACRSAPRRRGRSGAHSDDHPPQRLRGSFSRSGTAMTRATSGCPRRRLRCRRISARRPTHSGQRCFSAWTSARRQQRVAKVTAALTSAQRAR